MKMLNKGDKVELLFGGPIMTVVEQKNALTEESNFINKIGDVLCAWTSNGSPVIEHFPSKLLIKL